MRQWAPFSDSDPSDGIIYAIQSFWSPEKKISIYVFGDEFQGNSMEKVLRDIDRINIENEEGDRLVRIHAVGFPLFFWWKKYSSEFPKICWADATFVREEWWNVRGVNK